MGMRFHHFSIAVRDLEASMRRYEQFFGMKQVGEITDQPWGLKVVMMGTDEGPLVELMQPTRDDAAIKRFMDMREGPAYPNGEGPYLLALNVDDLEGTVANVEAAGGRITRDEALPTTVWVHPASNANVFVELIGPR